ncbi:MAG: flagellar biosynthesis protein FlhB [Planctomycetota bacterium]|jgi:flagellar biosynthetic protein FlhB
MADDLGEKTEDATPRRREDARKKGQVAKSQDLTGAILLGVMSVAIWFASRSLLSGGIDLVGKTLESDWISEVTVDGSPKLMAYLGMGAARLLVPLMLIAWFVALVSMVAQIGWMFSFEAIQPSLSKLNPITGAQRIFGLSGLMKVTMDSSKVLIVMVVSVMAIMRDIEEVVCLAELSLLQATAAIGSMLISLAMQVIAVLFILGLLDFMWQKWKTSRDLRMSKQEVKDEMKSTDGDPEVKKRRMRMQQQMALQRIGAAVPQADVIVTNPEHISIAIRYDAESMAAPRVVAKGADMLAMRIRQIAMKHGVPIVERKPLARALYRSVEVGQEVPAEFFQAVAEILAYVYRMNGKVA